MWEAEYRDIGIPTLVPAEQRVFFASAAQVRAVDVESGAGGWHTSLKGDPIHFYTNGPPALDDGTLYVAGHEGPGSRGKGRLVALDTQQGEPRWKFDTGTALRSPVVADGRVYVSDVEADTLYAFPAQPSSPPPLTSQD